MPGSLKAVPSLCISSLVFLVACALFIAPGTAFAVNGSLVAGDMSKAAPLASGMWGTCSWVADEQGVVTVGEGAGADTNGKSPWESIKDSDGKAINPVVVFSSQVKAPADCSCLFKNTSGVQGLSLLDTSSTTNMKRMFYSYKGAQMAGVYKWEKR